MEGRPSSTSSSRMEDEEDEDEYREEEEEEEEVTNIRKIKAKKRESRQDPEAHARSQLFIFFASNEKGRLNQLKRFIDEPNIKILNFLRQYCNHCKHGKDKGLV